MKPLLKSAFLAAGTVAALAAVLSPSFLQFGAPPSAPARDPLSVDRIPEGYRDWRLVSVAREDGTLDDIRAVLGNDVAIEAYRGGKRSFPDGAVLARLAWSYDASEANNAAFGQPQSFVAGPPKNGVQFMIKDAKRYAATGGWGFAQFDGGRPVEASMLTSCFPCHRAAHADDLVFTHYAP